MSKATDLADRLERYANGTLSSIRHDDDLFDAANELRRLYAFNEDMIKKRDIHWANETVLDNLQKLSTPESMQLVPLEPTDAMIDAANDMLSSNLPVSYRDQLVAAWKVMLATV